MYYNHFLYSTEPATPTFDLSPPYVVLGPACDDPAYFTATLTSRYLKDIQISYSANTPLLDNVKEVPLFYRTVPSYSKFGVSIYTLMKHFDWLRVGVVHKEVPHYTRGLENLNAVLASRSANPSNSDGDARVIASLGLNRFLKGRVNMMSNARIFVAMVPEMMAAETICAAYRSGMTGERFQWILIGDYQEDWYVTTTGTGGRSEGVECTTEEMIMASESALILSHQQPLELEYDVFSNSSRERFWREFATLVNTTTRTTFNPQDAMGATPAYDAVWTVAHALDRVLSQPSTLAATERSNSGSTVEYEYTGPYGVEGDSIRRGVRSQGRPITSFTSLLNSAMEETDFDGKSGRIQFDSQNHEIVKPLTYISQMQSGKMVPIGIHTLGGDLDLDLYGNTFRWQAGSPPRDRPVEVLQSIPLWVALLFMSITVIGIVFAVIVLVVNFMYRKHKVIKASSPYLNFAIALGCIMGFTTVLVISLDSFKVHFHLSLSVFPFLCNIRVWLLTIGFTLAFGALFAKTWRIYVIFRNPWVKKRPYKDYILFCMVAVFLSFDLVILVLWAAVDHLTLVREEIQDTEAFKIRRYAFCTSQFMPHSNVSFLVWIMLIAIPKAILLMFGIFLVVQTSKIKAKFFRDARFTGIAIFGFVMTCGIGVPVSFFTMFFYQEDLSYVVATTTILVCCYLILLMVFVPKFVLLRKYKNRVPSAILIGLNPSFRIRRNNRILKSERRAPIPYYTRMIRGLNDTSAFSKTSRLTVETESERPSTPSSGLQMDWSREDGTEGGSIGWECAFDEGDSDSDIEVQEARLDFGGYEYIASVGVLHTPKCRLSSTDTILTVLSDHSADDRHWSRTKSARGLTRPLPYDPSSHSFAAKTEEEVRYTNMELTPSPELGLLVCSVSKYGDHREHRDVDNTCTRAQRTRSMVEPVAPHAHAHGHVFNHSLSLDV